MKGEGHKLNLMFPTGLLFGELPVRLGLSIAKKYAPEAMEGIPVEAVTAICAELRRIKKRYGRWELAEVVSAEGDEVYISL